MLKSNVMLYYVTAGWILLAVVLSGYFLIDTTSPTADVEARYNPNVRHVYVGDMEPGDFSTFRINGRPIVIWRRNNEEMAKALTQLNPDFAFEETLGELESGAFARAVDPDNFTFLKWIIVSAVDEGGIGCIVTVKAGEFGGFYDPCHKSHFDLWGRITAGPSEQNLMIVPSSFDKENQSVLVDVTDMPR